ncbi:MAG: hypothetical protein M1832_004505 [Thelocarpon impressellum]|nr:MAG: hypothetical protein M1832_004505 [Thelocarpon impressellum]
MEVSNISPITFDHNPLSISKMDMDIDMDVDLVLKDEVSALEAEAMTITTHTTEPVVSSAPAAPAAYRSASLGASSPESSHPTPHKVHVRGLDNLHTSDINAFASEHFPSAQPLRVEWIDDTSANIVYDTPATAMKALASFSVDLNGEVTSIATLQSRPAKAHPTHPDARLEVRLAVTGDRKQPGARERSRYYLFNPDQDPTEKRSRGRARRGPSGYQHDGDNYRRRRYDDREHRRRRDGDEDAGFDVSLYDDDAPALAAREDRQRRRHSVSSFSSADSGRRRSFRRVSFTAGHTKELFPDRLGRSAGSRLRDRSASPDRAGDRDGDEDMGMDVNVGRLKPRSARERSYSPPADYNRASQQIPKANAAKELFPTKADINGDSSKSTRVTSPPLGGLGKELFPNKAPRNHRRSDAFDAADETADLFAGRMSVPFMDGAGDRRGRGARLADRITTAGYGRLEDTVSSVNPEELLAEEKVGMSIRGAAKQQNLGFSIRGAASGNPTSANGKEVFPGKVGLNAGKELFSEKLEGRGGQRRKAEDMFY